MKKYWKPEQLKRPSFAPEHWGGWFSVSLLWVLGVLPRWLGRALVLPLGPLLYRLLSSRRRVAMRNLERCLPELTQEQRQTILKNSFRSLARMLVETAWCWVGDRHPILSMTQLRGFEAVEALIKEGRGVLMVTPHVSCLEIGARAVAETVPGVGVYRPLRNPVIEWYQNRGRRHYARGMIQKHDMRGVIRMLREGGLLWYAPDQDFGPDQSAFAPFFGVETATLLATHRLPRMTGCAVVVMVPRWDAESGSYVIEVTAPLENFPGEDAQADLVRINAMLEAGVREALDQYWWIHRRFKTRPPGEPDFYESSEQRPMDSDTDVVT